MSELVANNIALHAPRLREEAAEAKTLPSETPLTMTAQRFDRNFVDQEAPAWSGLRSTKAWRALAFLPAILMTAGFAYTFHDFFKAEGVNALELAIMFLTSFAFVWIAMSVGFALTGAAALFLARWLKPAQEKPVSPLKVALLAPIYNEEPDAVFANGISALQDLLQQPSHHTFSLYFLSDSNSREIRERELRAFEAAKRTLPTGAEIFYRNRQHNVGKKAGNVADWCRRWGASHDAFLVLDADSLMNADCINLLADEIGRDPALALAQSLPRLVGARSLFARAQQFASGAFGRTLAAGIARVYGNQSSYWGHNAMIRTRAFARSAGLPDLPGAAPLGGTIMSHDFVEAALLCRAGWKVKLIANRSGSYEGTPQTLVDYCLRDQRWCQGNLQHLKVLTAKRLRPISRFQLFQGSMTYVASFAWFLLLIIWAGLAYIEHGREITYFSEDNPLMPLWPGMPGMHATAYLGIVYGMLLLPKIIGALCTLATNRTDELGGIANFAFSFVLEIVLSVVLAPIMMVQQSKAVVKTFLGFDTGWKPQNRAGRILPLSELARFHVLETMLGVALAIGIALGAITFWLLPIAFSLLFAVPISALTSMEIGGDRFNNLLGTLETYREPDISWRSKANREFIAAELS